MTMMTMKSTLCVIGVGLLMLSVGCTERAGIAPTELASNSTIREATASTSSDPVITLQPDLTASPELVTVNAGDSVLIVNHTSQYVRMRSPNCDEFIIVGLQPGASGHTWPFMTPGVTCDYYVSKWPDIVLQGKVEVQ
jgi:hypothetical protein